VSLVMIVVPGSMVAHAVGVIIFLALTRQSLPR
jgi:hypothetical protein